MEPLRIMLIFLLLSTAAGCDNTCDTCIAGQCTQCKSGYFESDGDCYQCFSDCDSCNSSATCDVCSAGYYRIGQSYCAHCPGGCTGCTSNTQCTTCQIGFYNLYDLTSGATLCSICSKHCASCTINTRCTQCEAGYYGVTCTYSCLNHCVGSECTISGCTKGCKARYYRHNDNICYACPTHCATCTSATQCSKCDTGYIGAICNQCIAGYYTDQNKDCLQCPIDCTICSSSTQCTACKTVHYGITCDHSCQDHCIDGECTQSGCTRGCMTGLYKDSDRVCKTCSPNCAACSSDTYCNQCDAGYYPHHRNAQHQDCQPCLSDCPRCVSSSQCTACTTGHYGVTCDHSCQDHCVDGECTINGCTRGCRNGYYKDSNKVCKTCSLNCNDVAKCNPYTGACAGGCKPGWTGIKCLENCPEHCTACNQVESDTCITCQRGYYGKSCESKCSENCKNNSTVNTICFKDNGICSHGCVQGHWGSNCDNICSDGCANKLQCSTSDGRCDKCIAERYGDHCKLKCSNNCDNPNNGSNICDQRTGACLYGCTSGLNGITCEEGGSATTGQGDGSNNTTAIAAGAGSVVVVAVVVVVIVCIVMRRRKQQNVEKDQKTTVVGEEISRTGGNGTPNYINVVHHENLGQLQEMGQLSRAQNSIPGTSDNLYMDLAPVPERDDHAYGTADPAPGTNNNPSIQQRPDTSDTAHVDITALAGKDEKHYVNLKLTVTN